MSASAPKNNRVRSTRELREFQRLMHAMVVRPLTPGWKTQRRWTDGRPAAEVAASFVKPNDRLASLDRIEIYNRVYWFRIIDCFYEDHPGLLAALGEKKFLRLARAYLTKYPSASFTLRNLTSRLERFLRAEPRLTAPRTALALEIARFERAQTVAFDEAALPVVTGADLQATPPVRLRLGLQPYLTLLTGKFPVDDFCIAVKKRDALRSEASNVSNAARHAAKVNKVPLPKPARTFVAVHRVDNRLFYKRLEPAAHRMLAALRDGAPLTRAVAAAGRGVTAEQVQGWFATWMQLGWFCKRPRTRRA